MARPTPVLPEVGSMIVPPGRNCPDASAASTMRSAIRSLTDPPGLKYSTLARTWGATPPTSSISDPWTCIASHLPCGSVQDDAVPAVLLHRRYPLRLSARALIRSPVLPWDGPGLVLVRVPGSCFTGSCRAERGLTVPPQAFLLSAPLAASFSRLRAAFASRSMTVPQCQHLYVRSDRGSLAFTVPHPEQVLLDGYQRSATMSIPPFHPVL